MMKMKRASFGRCVHHVAQTGSRAQMRSPQSATAIGASVCRSIGDSAYVTRHGISAGADSLDKIADARSSPYLAAGIFRFAHSAVGGALAWRWFRLCYVLEANGPWRYVASGERQ